MNVEWKVPGGIIPLTYLAKSFFDVVEIVSETERSEERRGV